MSAATSDRSDACAQMLAMMGPTGSAIGNAFRRMHIAEQEITKAKARWPRKRKQLHASFGILYTPLLRDHGDDLFRAHCRELLGRVMRGEDTAPGTDAEVLAMFSLTSLQAPLASEFAHAMSVVFHRVFPAAKREVFATGSEAWTGRTSEIIDDARKRLARDRSFT